MKKNMFKMAGISVLATSMLAGCSNGGAATGTQPEAQKGTETAQKVNLKFYYPVAVAGPLTKVMDAYVKSFNDSHPNINVEAVYSGDYNQTITKVQAAVKSGDMPDVAVLSATDVLRLQDIKAIVPLESYVKNDKDGDAYINDFFPGLLSEAKMGQGDHLWAIPYQRSTPLLYFNKEAFKEAGLDPNKAPANWEEFSAYAKKLTKKDASGQVTQWGGMIVENDTWIFQALMMQGMNGDKQVGNQDGTQVKYNTDATKNAINYLLKLAKEDKVIPEKLANGGTLPADFVAGKAAMIYNSSGSLAFIRDNAKFDFGTAFLPAGQQYAVASGGGNLYMFKTNDAKQKATWEFIRWMTSPEQAAKWSTDSGYVATRKSSYNVPTFQEYLAKFPQAAVPKDQLQYAGAWLTTHNNADVGKAMQDSIDSVFTAGTPVDQSLADAQSKIDAALKPFKK
ncbi:ABC transporter substrate-binding protein [Paenibacillus filicis]|uniref:ABC transporter substrate-binding protein n=1 Tax=Paenibacillus gyeongsangnamensis TaxID=3388067 RepID=A0ABT4Q3S7_9BACL|nr:ABC transporter substrate-binding protein [Paenibacillus filicis]MCZ8511526.1 ABC transporter substrate-binding protein [Paenibacillus filicis]